jgi:hypothetical protein
MSKTGGAMPEKITTISIDETLLERGKDAAKRNRVSLSIVLTTLLKEWLDGNIKDVVIPLESEKI